MNSSPPKQTESGVSVSMTTVYTTLGVILGILYHAGAAKLSYDKYGSIGWAILAFIFGAFYYPYYAFFESGKTTSMLGGALRKMKW
jgi:ABC-type multidrug transport system permease subunit